VPAGTRVDLRPMKLGEMVDASIKLYQANFATLAGITAVIIVPWTLLIYAIDQSDSIVAAVVAFSGGFAISPIVSGAVAWAAAELYLGRDPGVGQTYSHVGRRLGAVVAVALLTGLAIMLGFILLIVPGLILMARLFAATVAVVIEDRGATDAIRRSADLVKGTTGRVLGYLIVMGILVAIATGILGAIGSAVGDAGNLALQVIASVLFMPLSAVFGVLLYFDLRIRKEGFDLEVMARELTGSQ